MSLAAGRPILGTRDHPLAACLDTLVCLGGPGVLHDLNSPQPRDDSTIDHAVVTSDRVVVISALNLDYAHYWTRHGVTRAGRRVVSDLHAQIERRDYAAAVITGYLRHHGLDVPVEALSVACGSKSVVGLDFPHLLDLPHVPRWWSHAVPDQPANDQVRDALTALVRAPIRPTGYIAAGVD